MENDLRLCKTVSTRARETRICTTHLGKTVSEQERETETFSSLRCVMSPGNLIVSAAQEHDTILLNFLPYPNRFWTVCMTKALGVAHWT